MIIFWFIMLVTFLHGARKGLQAFRAGLQGPQTPQRVPVVAFYAQRPSKGWRN